MRVGAIGGKEARINLNNIKVIKRENSFSAQKNRSKETSLLRFGAADRTWTGMVLLPRDFKSLVSADFTTAANRKTTR